MEYIGPFAFNGLRFILGSISLFPLIFLQRYRGFKIRKAFPGALLAGSCVFVAVSLQQIGIMFTTAGNAGFITGLYVVLTPIFGIFLGRKTGAATWIGVIFTFTGLYFISNADHSGTINPGDILVAFGSVFWAFHVLLIDRLVQKTDPIILSSGQFIFCGILSLIAAFIFEPVLAEWLKSMDQISGLFMWTPFPTLITGTITEYTGAIIPILFGGLVSVGIAYTLQVVAQRNAPPAHTTIILCLEGCFAALGGIILLGEALGTWTIFGFIFMLTGMLISQWEVIYKSRT